jgi:hypothetical protein
MAEFLMAFLHWLGGQNFAWLLTGTGDVQLKRTLWITEIL